MLSKLGGSEHFFHIHTNIYCLWPETQVPSSQTTPPPIPQVPGTWTQGLRESAPPLFLLLTTLKINTRVSAQPQNVFDSTVHSALIQWRYCVSHFNIYSINPQWLHVSAQTLLTSPEIPQALLGCVPWLTSHSCGQGRPWKASTSWSL